MNKSSLRRSVPGNRSGFQLLTLSAYFVNRLINDHTYDIRWGKCNYFCRDGFRRYRRLLADVEFIISIKLHSFLVVRSRIKYSDCVEIFLRLQ